MISTTKLFFPKYQSLRYFAVRSRVSSDRQVRAHGKRIAV